MTWLEFQVTLAIKLSLQVYTEPSYVAWASRWLDGSDRTSAASYAAAYATSDAASSIKFSIGAGAKLESVVKFL